MSEETDLEEQDAIAVIGMSGRFPGAASVDQLWDNIDNQRESISFFEQAKMKDAGVSDSFLNDPAYVNANALVEDPALFDADFFNMTPREAEITDPQHRVFLECCWQAMENAGYDSQQYSGNIGVFAGAGMSSYLLKNLLGNSDVLKNSSQFQLQMGNAKEYLATRVAYKMDLRGPAISINTACSTSLVAIHSACQSLLDFQSDIAIAGGVSIDFPQEKGYLYDENGITSVDGHCRAFDASATGTVNGNGAAVVVLKRLEDALADGDHISAVVLGSAINNDGSDKVGFTAPSINGQARVIAEALEVAGVDAGSIEMIEAHGTGTTLGDPIEVAALKEAYVSESDDISKCALGSIKSNIGHLDEAAGAAGFLKAVLSLKNKTIPASLHFKEINPKIDLGDQFYVSADRKEWASKDHPRRAAVSSFGIGGTNAHAILQEAPELTVGNDQRTHFVLPFSAGTPGALKQIEKNILSYLEANPNVSIGDVAFTLSLGRRQLVHRSALVCKDRVSAIKALKDGLDAHKSEATSTTVSIEGVEDSAEAMAKIAEQWKEAKIETLAPLFEEGQYRRMPLPTYPFDRKLFWVEENIKEDESEVIPNSDSAFSDYLYVPTWKANSIQSSSDQQNDSWLILCNESEFGSLYSKELLGRDKKVTMVSSGDGYQKINEGIYVINSANAEDYQTLLRELSGANNLPANILHISNLESKNSEDESLSLVNEFFSLLYLTKGLDQYTSQEFRVLIASTQGYKINSADEPAATKGTLSGAVKVINQEYSSIRCSVIDFNNAEVGEIIDAAIAESTATDSEQILAYRGAQRYTQSFDKAETADSKEVVFKKNGAYLITGGLGGIGLTIARHLAKQYQARLCLIGQSSVELRGESVKKELEQFGAQVILAKADVSDYEQMKEVFDDGVNQFGSFDGIIHAAGIPDGGSIVTVTDETAKSVLSAKVQGTLVLDRLLEGHKPDFVVLCSSLSAAVGSFGQFSYCAANSFMDGFAAYGKQNYISIGWDAWREVGMAVDSVKTERDESSDTRILNADSDWLLKEHCIDGISVLPGTAYIEIASADFKKSTGTNKCVIEELYFLQPMAVESGQSVEVKTVFDKDGDGTSSFVIKSRINGVAADWADHAQGTIKAHESDQSLLDIDKVIAKYSESLTDFEQIHQLFGPRWHCLKEAWGNKEEALCRLELNEDFSSDRESYELHPAVLDIATGYLALCEGESKYLPFSYESIEVYAPLPSSIYTYIRRQESTATLKYDVSLVDSEGRSLLEVKEYSLRETREPVSMGLQLDEPGSLDNLLQVSRPRAKPAANEVEVMVKATGLNFKEVLTALGMIPFPEEGSFYFGLECAGTITSVGTAVSDYQVGDDVVCFAQGSMTSFINTDVKAIAKKPAHISFEEAATIPAAFCTAYYALVTKANLKQGEKVLIHAAAGGVGMAAVIVAQSIGAEIYATAGSPEKRDYLKSIGIKHVMDSRTTEFADYIRQETNETGVDVVLNSLSGEFIDKSMEILGLHGRFLEIGIRDIQENTKIGLGYFAKCLSYHAIGVGTDMPEFSELWEAVFANFENKNFKPLPLKLFTINDVSKAFDYMARAKHIGKIIVTQPQNDLSVAKADGNSGSLIKGLSNAEGIAVLEEALRMGQAHVVVCKHGFEAVHVEDAQEEETVTRYPRPDLPYDYKAPENDTQEALASIWQELLGIDKVGIDDDFWDLDGDSLLAAQLISRMDKECGLKISLGLLFEESTIAQLAEHAVEEEEGVI